MRLRLSDVEIAVSAPHVFESRVERYVSGSLAASIKARVDPIALCWLCDWHPQNMTATPLALTLLRLRAGFVVAWCSESFRRKSVRVHDSARRAKRGYRVRNRLKRLFNALRTHVLEQFGT